MQVKVLSALSSTVPTGDPTSVDPTPPASAPLPYRVLNYLGTSPKATNGSFFTGVFHQRMQQVVKFVDTGDLYQGQGRDGGAVGDLGSQTIEDMAVSHFTPAGIFLDSMVLVDGGHGWSIGLESRGPGLSPYVWSVFAGPGANGATNTLIRFPYTPGTFTYAQIPGVQVYSAFGNPNPVLAFDWRSDSMVMGTGVGGSYLRFQKRKISEFKAGTDVVYSTITLPDTPGSQIYQGFFTYQNSLFVYTGSANDPVNQPVLLTEYDWNTSAVVTKFNGTNMGKVNGSYLGNWYEPEGASLYDVDGNNPTALIGMTFYPYGQHQSQYFSIPLRTPAQAADTTNPGSVATPIPVVQPDPNAELGAKLLTAVPAVAGATLHPASLSVLQCLVYEPTTRQYFTSSAENGTNGSDTPYQNTIISRLSSSGALLDSMTLHDAGHGTSFGVHIENGSPVIYINYQISNQDLVSFTYTAGTFDYGTLPNVQTWDRPDAGYDNMQFDWDNDVVVMRNSSGTRDSYIRRKISEWKAGIDVTYGRIDLQQGPPTLQGFCTLNDSFYRLIGGGSGGTGSDVNTYIQQYSWDSGVRLDQVNYTALGKSSAGAYPGGTYEPEGVTMYRESDGTASLIFSVTFDVPGSHSYKVYKLPNIGNTVEAFDLADPSTALQNSTQSPLG